MSNVAPRQTHDMVMEYLEGDHDKGVKLQLELLDLCGALFCEVNPIPVKKAMKLMGMDCGPLRMPLTELTPAHTEELAHAMKDFGIQLA